jgi:hypothetical protein
MVRDSCLLVSAGAAVLHRLCQTACVISKARVAEDARCLLWATMTNATPRELISLRMPTTSASVRLLCQARPE